jgi:group I intron endonuclease
MYTVGIYKITNPNGKVYIGQSIEIEKRLYKYKSANCKKQTKILNSIKKYGWDAHSFEIIHKCLASELNDLEVYYINKFNSLNDGLNLAYGGRSSLLTDEHKQKIANSLRGKKRPNSVVEKQKATMVNLYSNKVFSEKELLVFRELAQKRPDFLYSQNKVVLDISNGVFYDSLKSVSNLYGLNYNTLKGRLNGSKINNTNFIYA